MSLFSPLWDSCKTKTNCRFSTQLFDRFSFDFYFTEHWKVEPIERALALNAVPRNVGDAWQLYAGTSAECDITTYLAEFSRDSHGQLALNEPHMSAFYDALHGVFRVYDFAARKAAIICLNDYVFSEWELYSPFREFWHVWALHNEVLLVHSGMVCEDNRAVLLPARGGSGKSTTVLSCLESGLTTTGDDYNLLLKNSDHYVAAPLYTNIKMKNDSIFDFKFLAEWPREVIASAHKTVYHPPPDASLWNKNLPRVVGILCPSINNGEVGIKSINPALLLNQLAVSSIMQSPYHAAEYLARTSALAKQVKSAKLCLSPTLEDNVQHIRDWLAVI